MREIVNVSVEVYENEGRIIGKATGPLWFTVAPRIGEKVFMRRDTLYFDGVVDAGLPEVILVEDVIHIPGLNGESNVCINLEDIFVDEVDRAKYILNYLNMEFELELEFFI